MKDGAVYKRKFLGTAAYLPSYAVSFIQGKQLNFELAKLETILLPTLFPDRIVF